MTCALRSILALVAVMLVSTAPHAALFRAYLSGTGSDSNPCTLPAPCRLLPAALAAVADGGEIWMLDSANFNTGAVTIDKSISILAVPGGVGSLVSSDGPAIVINTGNLTVALRNIVFVPLATISHTPVQMSGASRLHIEKCVFANFSFSGGVDASAGATTIVDSTFRNLGLFAVRARDGAKASIARTTFSGMRNFAAVHAVGASPPTSLTLSDSVISDSVTGVLATADAGTSAKVSITRTTISGNGVAIHANTDGGEAAVMSAANTVVGNNAAWVINGGTIVSFGNNHFWGNVTSVGSLTPAARQ